MIIIHKISDKYVENTGLSSIKALRVKSFNEIINNVDIVKEKDSTDISDFINLIKNGSSKAICFMFGSGENISKISSESICLFKDIINLYPNFMLKNADFSSIAKELKNNGKLKEAILHLHNGIDWNKYGDIKFIDIDDSLVNEEYYKDMYFAFQESERKSIFKINDKLESNRVCKNILLNFYRNYLESFMYVNDDFITHDDDNDDGCPVGFFGN